MKVDLKSLGAVDGGSHFEFDFPRSNTVLDERVNQSFLRGRRPMLLNGWFYTPQVGTEPAPGTCRVAVRKASIWDLVVWAYYRAKHHALGYGW